MKAVVPILYLLNIAAAECVTVYFNPVVGTILHLIILISLLTHASFSTAGPYGKLLFSLCLVPIIRVLSLSMPLALFPQTYWKFIISIPVLAVTFMAISTLKLRPSEVGLTLQKMPVQIPIQVLVGLTGIGFGFLEYQILNPEPMIPVLTWARIWLPALIFLIAVGFTEELVFRGVIQRTSMNVMGSWGLVYTAAVFTVLQIGYSSWMQGGIAFLCGLFFGWIVNKTGSILGVSLAHGTTNISLYLVIPLVL